MSEHSLGNVLGRAGERLAILSRAFAIRSNDTESLQKRLDLLHRYRTFDTVPSPPPLPPKEQKRIENEQRVIRAIARGGQTHKAIKWRYNLGANDLPKIRYKHFDLFIPGRRVRAWQDAVRGNMRLAVSGEEFSVVSKSKVTNQKYTHFLVRCRRDNGSTVELMAEGLEVVQ